MANDRDTWSPGKKNTTHVPVGLEHLLALASTSEEFARALAADPLRAAQAAGIELTRAEEAVLGAVDAPALDAMIARVKPALEEPDRRLFFEQAAAAVAFLVGGAALSGCQETTSPTNVRHEPPPKRRPERPPALSGGARIDRADEPAPPGGIQPDRPPRPPDPPARPDAGAPRDTAPLPPGGSGTLPRDLTPPREQRYGVPTAGASADAPRNRPTERHAKGGVRPR